MKCLTSVVLVLLVASILVVENFPGIYAQSECKGDFGAIIAQCKQFVKKEGPQIPPSKACCDAIGDADIPCLCKHVTGEIECLISVQKAIYVVKTCGAKAPPGTKCGSYTIPPSPSPILAPRA